MTDFKKIRVLGMAVTAVLLFACQDKASETPSALKSQTGETTEGSSGKTSQQQDGQPAFTSAPLVTHMFTADPSAHVFDNRLYIYPSHDIETEIPANEYGDHFAMRDYHVFSMDKVGGKVTDHGVALDIKDVAWADRQMWAPDAAEKDGKYFLYFPAKNKQGIFHIGVATSNSPTGPFKAKPEPIRGSYSIDPSVYKDTDGTYYMYLGGIRGGQLQRWSEDGFSLDDVYPAADQAALMPKVARMKDNMLGFMEGLKDVQILDDAGKPLLAGDNERRFFEAAWVHKHNGKYYFSYSTGDTHNIAYATGDSPYGPFTYRGVVLKPVLGWTNHHSIVEFKGKWYLFYHDSSLSGGQTHLRSVKMAELVHNPDGTIQTLSAFAE